MPRKKKPRGVRQQPEVTVKDVIQVHRQAHTLLGLLEGEQELLDRAQVDPAAKIELEGSLAAIERDVPKAVRLPSAKAMMVAALSSSMSKELVLTLYHRAIRAMHAMAPIVAIKLAEKMDDHQAPGSTRVLIEMAKGLGLFVPAEPMKAKARMDMMDEDSLREKSDEELKDEVLNYT